MEGKFKLKVDRGITDPKKRFLNITLGISNERFRQLAKKIRIYVIEGEKEDLTVDVSIVLQRLIEECETVEEVVMVSYMVGKSHGETQSRGSGLGGILGMILKGDQVIGGDPSEGEGGEDDAISDLIRQSYNINGKGKKDKEE